MMGEAELGMMNGECGIVGGVMKTSDLEPSSVSEE